MYYEVYSPDSLAFSGIQHYCFSGNRDDTGSGKGVYWLKNELVCFQPTVWLTLSSRLSEAGLINSYVDGLSSPSLNTALTPAYLSSQRGFLVGITSVSSWHKSTI